MLRDAFGEDLVWTRVVTIPVLAVGEVAGMAVLGHKAAYPLGRALGLPDELPVQSIVIDCTAGKVVTARVVLVPTPNQVEAVKEWVAANAAGIKVEPVVEEGWTFVGPDGVVVHRKGGG